jgi:soluble lytic murein transglycosylase-like protein
VQISPTCGEKTAPHQNPTLWEGMAEVRKFAGNLFDFVTSSVVLSGFLAVMLFAMCQQLLRQNALRWESLSAYRKIAFPSLLLVALSALLVVFNAGSGVLNAQQDGFAKKTVAVAIPFQGRTPFPAQVSLFSQRMSLGFGIDESLAKEFSVWILEAAERQKLSPELIASLVLTESSFRKYVVSHVGAVGPTQVRPDYWASFCGAINLKDPEQNVYCGAQVLRHLVDRCAGNYNCALSAYNVGFNATPGPAAARYIAKIDLHMDWLENAL